MPEFILEMGDANSARAYQKLDAFTRGYIEAAFFTETGYEENGDLETASFGEIEGASLGDIIEDCRAWQEANHGLLERAYARNYTAEQAGRDYWFTRNHHGVGFWDRSELDADDLGKALSNAAHTTGEVYVARGDDGAIYFE